MNALVIVLVVVVILGVIALIAFNPMLKKREDAALAVQVLLDALRHIEAPR